ncbi:hypothetical protein A2U01_0062278, partial [Trifolium medium]|nr:hypothetical protein [Trifolium medium]
MPPITSRSLKVTGCKGNLLGWSTVEILQHISHTDQPFTCFRGLILSFECWWIHSAEFTENGISPWNLELNSLF